MDKDETKVTTASKAEYTFEMLLNDLQDKTDENAKESETKDRAERESQHKLVVLQMLIYFAASYRSEEYKDDDKLGNAIDIKVNGEELLSGFLFYVSQNPQFDYSWNYMRKKKKNYSKFLVEAVRYFNNMITDLNMISSKTRTVSDVHIVFDDIFDVALIKEMPYVKARVLWENFNRMAASKRDYYISVKIKESLLVAGIRKEPSDAEKIIDDALDKIKDKVIVSESK
jgi:hypothetical protein